MIIYATAFSDLSGEKSTPGGMVHLIEVCKNLQSLGHSLTLFVSSRKRYKGELPFKVVYLPYVDLRFVATLMQPIFLFIYLIIYGFRQKCDVIYENTVLYSVSGVIAAKILGVKHCMHVHGFYTEEIEMGGHGAFRIWLIELTEKINYALTDALFCVTPVVRNKVEEKYRIRPGVANFVYNGVDAERCKPIPKEKVATELDFDPSKKYVGFIGYLFPWSGVENVIEAATEIVKEVPETIFVIVGHGMWGDHLPRLADEKGLRDSFIFTGYQPWERIPLYCNLFDVGVTPYPGEKGVGRYRSSMKTLEYSAAGTAVVITRCEGVSDIVENAKCGIVVEPDNNKELASAIITLLKDDKLREELGINGRKLIEAEYTWKHVAKKMMNIILSK